MDRLNFRSIFQKIIFQSAVFFIVIFLQLLYLKYNFIPSNEVARSRHRWDLDDTVTDLSTLFIKISDDINTIQSLYNNDLLTQQLIEYCRWQDRHGRDIIEQMTGACACDGASKRSVRPGQIHYSSYLWRPKHDKNRHPISQSKISHKLRVLWDQRLLESAKYVTRVTRHFCRSAVNMYSTLTSWYVILQI